MKIETGPYYTFDDVLIQPQFSDIASRDEIDTSVNFLGIHLSAPIISSNMSTVTESEMALAMYRAGGLGILHRFTSPAMQYWNLTRIVDQTRIAAYSVGTRDLEESLAFISKLREEFPNSQHIVCIDVAHGFHSKVIWLIGEIKTRFPGVKVIAGNVASSDGAYELALAGADAIKVGIGPGSACTTRIVTGVGVPQLSAIAECADALKYHSVAIIADGGIPNSGDIAKAIGAGADVVMIGKLLAGASEAPGRRGPEASPGNYMKLYEGQSIYGVNKDKFTPEGVSSWIKITGPAEDTIKQLMAGLRSGMSYVGARNIDEFRQKCVFLPVTQTSLAESHERITA